MCSNEVDWRKVLRNFCGMSQRANKSRTMKRINRKYPYIHSGRKIGHSANVAVYVDQSGSVDDDALALLYAELNQLARKVTFTFIPFDSSVDTENEFVWKRGSKAILTRYRCGGTNFVAVAEHANNNRHRFDGYIVMTDGEAADPGVSRLRRAWVIVPGRQLLFDVPRGDTLVQMKEAKRNAA
jgi:predicted metal-dependent peptidase